MIIAGDLARRAAVRDRLAEQPRGLATSFARLSARGHRPRRGRAAAVHVIRFDPDAIAAARVRQVLEAYAELAARNRTDEDVAAPGQVEHGRSDRRRRWCVQPGTTKTSTG
jgi:hypothetical protein